MAVDTIEETTLAVFRAIDSMDAGEFARFFAQDATFQFGNAAPAAGRDAVEAAVGGFFSTLGGLRHDITGIWRGTWEGGEVTSVESFVIYTRKDGSTTTPIPVTSTLRWHGGEIQAYQIFGDISPLYQPEG